MAAWLRSCDRSPLSDMNDLWHCVQVWSPSLESSPGCSWSAGFSSGDGGRGSPEVPLRWGASPTVSNGRGSSWASS